MSKFAVAVMNLASSEIRAFVIDANDRREAVIGVSVGVLEKLGSDKDTISAVNAVTDMTTLSSIMEECDILVSRATPVDGQEHPEDFDTEQPEDPNMEVPDGWDSNIELCEEGDGQI